MAGAGTSWVRVVAAAAAAVAAATACRSVGRDAMLRPVTRSWTARPVTDGAGVRIRRVFGHGETAATDPFLMLDHFGSDDPDDFMAGFPMHPHRGIETVTYMLKGRVEHADSLGNRGVIGPGDVQWMTAGSGIIHEEMPRNDGGLSGFQLWVNLPRADKMCPPRYQGFEAASLPVVDAGGGATARLVAGELGGRAGPVQGIATRPLVLDASLPAGASLDVPVGPDRNGFVYVFGGAVSVAGGAPLPEGTLGLLGDGDTVRLVAAGGPARVLLAVGTPLREPIAWYGPIVMNTEEELRQAFEDYRDGTFVRR